MFSLSYSSGMVRDQHRRWAIRVTGSVKSWLRELRQDDPDVYRSVNVAIDMLAEIGPGLGRPLVDTLQGSDLSNLKELRPRSGRDVAIRLLFVFECATRRCLYRMGVRDPRRRAVVAAG